MFSIELGMQPWGGGVGVAVHISSEGADRRREHFQNDGAAECTFSRRLKSFFYLKSKIVTYKLPNWQTVGMHTIPLECKMSLKNFVK